MPDIKRRRVLHTVACSLSDCLHHWLIAGVLYVQQITPSSALPVEKELCSICSFSGGLWWFRVKRLSWSGCSPQLSESRTHMTRHARCSWSLPNSPWFSSERTDRSERRSKTRNKHSRSGFSSGFRVQTMDGDGSLQCRTAGPVQSIRVAPPTAGRHAAWRRRQKRRRSGAKLFPAAAGIY